MNVSFFFNFIFTNSHHEFYLFTVLAVSEINKQGDKTMLRKSTLVNELHFKIQDMNKAGQITTHIWVIPLVLAKAQLTGLVTLVAILHKLCRAAHTQLLIGYPQWSPMTIIRFLLELVQVVHFFFCFRLLWWRVNIKMLLVQKLLMLIRRMMSLNHSRDVYRRIMIIRLNYRLWRWH
jgi:hypothetical protein